MPSFSYLLSQFCGFFHSIPETFVNISSQAIVSYLCLNLAITPIFIACQTQLMLSVFAVLFFFINTALLLITLGLEYLGLAILLVYAGAIIMILLFVIMLVKLQETERQPFSALNPTKWKAEFLPLTATHTKIRSGFLIATTVIGAMALTYSCKSMVSEIYPISEGQISSFAPSLEIFGATLLNLTSNPYAGEIQCVEGNLVPQVGGLFNTVFNPKTPNYIPWLLTYFNGILEAKFQPIVLETPSNAIWSALALSAAPSYNLDRFTFNLAEHFGILSEILPKTDYSQSSITLEKLPGSWMHDVINPLIDYTKTERLWGFYPRTRLGVYEFPSDAVGSLRANPQITSYYAQISEWTDYYSLPKQDISVISSVLYTLHAPSLVLASICLFIAMVLSFLLTDFKLKD